MSRIVIDVTTGEATPAADVDPIVESIAARRAAAELPFADLVDRLLQANLITPAEAIDWAKTDAVPASIVSEIMALSGNKTRAQAYREASVDSAFGRNSLFISVLQSAYGVSDVQLDNLFGV